MANVCDVGIIVHVGIRQLDDDVKQCPHCKGTGEKEV